MFKIRNELAVEIHKSKKRRNVAGHNKRWPVLVDFLLGHYWAIAIVATVNAQKFHTLGEEDAFLQEDRQVLGQIDLKLACHIRNSFFKGRIPAKDVINNDSSASLCMKNNSMIVCKVLPSGVKVIDKYNENDRAVDRTKRHDSVGILGVVRASKGQLYLGRLRHANLIVSRNGIKKPAPENLQRSFQQLHCNEEWAKK